MPGTPRPEYVSTKQQRIAELARNCPDMAFTTLAHHIDIEWMLAAHLGHAGTEPSAWTDKPRRNTRSIWRPTSRTSSTAQIRHVRGAARASSAYPQGGLAQRDSSARDTHV